MFKLIISSLSALIAVVTASSHNSVSTGAPMLTISSLSCLKLVLIVLLCLRSHKLFSLVNTPIFLPLMKGKTLLNLIDLLMLWAKSTINALLYRLAHTRRTLLMRLGLMRRLKVYRWITWLPLITICTFALFKTMTKNRFAPVMRTFSELIS